MRKFGKPANGSWSRLRPVELDPLESVGLPSKGDKKLLNLKAQEKYYTKIIERYLSFCTDASHEDELMRRFETLEINEAAKAAAALTLGFQSTPSPGANVKLADRPPTIVKPGDDSSEPTMVAPTAIPNLSDTKALSEVIMALRKLREGIVATKRKDQFAAQAYIFCIRLSVLVKQPDSYHPAILHLLRTIHPACGVTAVEVQEMVGYLVLDAACRRRQLAEAYSLRRIYRLRDNKIKAALDAITHDNYFMFHRVMNNVDRHKAKVMEWAEPDMRLHTLKCIGRSYLSVERTFVEFSTATSWEDLKKNDNVGWELNGNEVTVRRVRAK